jgi:hypothetical protein
MAEEEEIDHEEIAECVALYRAIRAEVTRIWPVIPAEQEREHVANLIKLYCDRPL